MLPLWGNSVVEFCVIHFEVRVDTEHYITVFTILKWPRSPSFKLYLQKRPLPGQWFASWKCMLVEQPSPSCLFPAHKTGASFNFQAMSPLSISRSLRTTLLWVITQRVVVISYRCFGTTYRSKPGGSKTWTLRMGPLCNNPKERSSRLLCSGSLKLFNIFGSKCVDTPCLLWRTVQQMFHFHVVKARK